MKYRALIVDDERIIVNGIMRLPIWLSLDIEPVPAMTGLQALELMEQYRFDLIITDIRMPEMDGLEFISQMRKVYPDIPTVVLSGYDSFAYAKEAIHYGVSDYLLKPISQLDLSDTITRIFHEIEEKKEARQQEEMLRGTVKQTIRDANAQQLENGLLGGPDNGRLDRLLGSGYILAECIPCEREEENLGGLNILLENIKQIVLGPRRDSRAVVTLFMGHVVFAVNQETMDFGRLLSGIREWSDKNEYPFSVSWIPVTSGDCVADRYSLLTRISSYRFYYDKFCILSEEETKSAEGEPCFNALEKAVKDGNAELALTEMEDVIYDLRRLNKSPEETRTYCARLYLLLAKYTNEHVRETGIVRLLMTSARTDFNGLAAMLRQLLTQWETDRSEKNQASFSSTVQKAMLYVHDHLSDEGLSIAAVAGTVLFIHPDYFGKLFKKETGIAFTRYVMDLRMDRAKKLIAERPDIKVYELCEATGFGENPHYFSQVFRSCCGCTPSEYKRAMGNVK